MSLALLFCRFQCVTVSTGTQWRADLCFYSDKSARSAVRESGGWCVHMVVVAAVLDRLYRGWERVVCGCFTQFVARDMC